MQIALRKPCGNPHATPERRGFYQHLCAIGSRSLIGEGAAAASSK
jgi:hypothetical protein